MRERSRVADPLLAWDARQAARAFGIAALLAAIAWLVTAVSDEGGLSFGVRTARTLPAAPVCAALATWIVHARARARGELLALETLGVGPRRSGAPAVAGGAALAVLFAVAIAVSPRLDVAVFFPAIPHAGEVRFVDGGFVDARRGARVEIDGALARLPRSDASGATGLPRGARPIAALAVAMSGIALALVAASRTRGAIAGVAALGTAAAMLVGFHAAAASAVAAPAVVMPPGVLLAWAIVHYRRTGDRPA